MSYGELLQYLTSLTNGDLEKTVRVHVAAVPCGQSDRRRRWIPDSRYRRPLGGDHGRVRVMSRDDYIIRIAAAILAGRRKSCDLADPAAATARATDVADKLPGLFRTGVLEIQWRGGGWPKISDVGLNVYTDSIF
jgi:hypothetical protein